MKQSQITLHTLSYSKTDLEKIPPEDRLFFLMSTGLANDILMLNKALSAVIDNGEWHSETIVKQGNSAFGMLILRMLAGRLREGWHLISRFSKTLKSSYEIEMSTEEKAALKELRAYFNPGKGKMPLIVAVRDKLAFHSLPEAFGAAFASLDVGDDLGDYLHETMGNTLYYTTEVLQYEALKNLAGTPDHETALVQLLGETQRQTRNFNTAIYGFAFVFAKRHMPSALHKLKDEAETITVSHFNEMYLQYFSYLEKGAQ